MALLPSVLISAVLVLILVAFAARLERGRPKLLIAIVTLALISERLTVLLGFVLASQTGAQFLGVALVPVLIKLLYPALRRWDRE